MLHPHLPLVFQLPEDDGREQFLRRGKHANQLPVRVPRQLSPTVFQIAASRPNCSQTSRASSVH